MEDLHHNSIAQSARSGPSSLPREKYILLHLGSSVHFYCVGRRLEAMRKRAQRQMEQSDRGYVSCAIYHADIHTRRVSEPSAISI